MIAGNADSGAIVWTPWPGIAKSMVLALGRVGVGIEDRLAERAGAAVVGVDHQEGGQQRPVFHGLEPRAEAEERAGEGADIASSSRSSGSRQGVRHGSLVGWVKPTLFFIWARIGGFHPPDDSPSSRFMENGCFRWDAAQEYVVFQLPRLV